MADRVAQAIAAQQLLDNETFLALLAKIEADAVDALAAADVSNPASLIRATADLQAARRVREAAESIVTTGMAAQRVPPTVA
ncbi:hypothetical protein IPV08_15975 [Methylobacterium sp. SD274]|uniref:hypothetical protein n=1 Tax=Methylobacterium sp. SD274 TaxID=2782009 RepID=UPI001A976688|nr:hypothetical protein [Methylobacterium sp. SD274]MBO1021459.1 hypothetical protein [Methylobacterium sp. SD274]